MLTQVADLLAADELLERADFVPIDYSQQQLVHLATTVAPAERARIARVAERAPVRVLLRQTNRETLFAVEE